MIKDELLFLGLLRESPKHGYEIKRKIREILSVFTGVELRSVYYPLQTLEKKGLVVKHAAKSGKRPQRFTYELTARGRERFEQLLEESLLKLNRPQFSLDLSLYFLHYIDPAVAKRRLNARIYMLKKLIKAVRQAIQSQEAGTDPSLKPILRHDLQMVEAEGRFLSQLVKTFR